VIAHGNVLSPVAWSNIKTGSYEQMLDCHALPEGGVRRCGFEAAMPDGSVVLRLTRGDHDVFSLELDVP
jgi:hypothetical protein